MLGLLLVAFGVGAGNFAVSVAIGLRGVDAATRIRVGVAFGLFEGGMPVAGVFLGKDVAPHIGGTAHVAGGALLVGIGLYQLVSAWRTRNEQRESEPISTVRLTVTALALSLDNFVAGLALGAIPVSLVIVALTIALVSATLSLVGLEIARFIGPLFGTRAELFGGVVLGGVGVCLISGVLT